MKAILRHPLRFVWRTVWFGGELCHSFLRFLLLRMRTPDGPREFARALGLQRQSRACLRSINATVTASGALPTRGLLVSNHLSYLDILVLSSLAPAVFVAKSEVQGWPVFGWFAREGGSLFIERTKRSDVARVNEQVARVLNAGVLLVIFPEGTSSDGSDVLPFKSSLLEPIVGQAHPITTARIRYEVDDGDPAQDVCYWGAMSFGPHLLNLLTKRRIRASVTFNKFDGTLNCRKELARLLHAEVRRLGPCSSALTVNPTAAADST